MLSRVLRLIFWLFLLSAVAPLLEPLAQSPSEVAGLGLEALLVGGLMLWLRLPPEFKPRSAPDPSWIRWLLLSLPLTLLLAGLVAAITHFAGIPDVLEALQPIAQYRRVDWAVDLSFGPLLEELFLRQVVYDSLRRRGVEPIRSALLSGMAGAAFQLAGFAQGRRYAASVMLQAFAALVQGLLFSPVREKSRSVLPSTFLHICYNAVYLALSWYFFFGPAAKLG